MRAVSRTSFRWKGVSGRGGARNAGGASDAVVIAAGTGFRGTFFAPG